MNTDGIKRDGEKEIGTEVAMDTWDKGLIYVNNCSLNARHCLIEFKILHRLHYSKLKRHRIFPEMLPVCEECNQADADLSYSYVLCPKLQDLWAAIFLFYSSVFRVQLTPDPLLVILGASETSKNLQNAQHHPLSYGLLCAKKLIILLWKRKDVPTFKAWITLLTDTLHLERIRYILSDRLEEFEKIWRPMISFMERMDS